MPGVSDEAALLERLGGLVFRVEGSGDLWHVRGVRLRGCAVASGGAPNIESRGQVRCNVSALRSVREDEDGDR
jgi:hypothetical protein